LAPARADGHHSGNLSYGDAIAPLTPFVPSCPYLPEVDHPPDPATVREIHRFRIKPKGRCKDAVRIGSSERMNQSVLIIDTTNPSSTLYSRE